MPSAGVAKRSAIIRERFLRMLFPTGTLHVIVLHRALLAYTTTCPPFEQRASRKTCPLRRDYYNCGKMAMEEAGKARVNKLSCRDGSCATQHGQQRP
ncbi:MAG: hypothetical protein HGA41_07545 [Syntrophaceae bacterium]|nr:hypothetical protein [Syntrophaceae bacterium]